MVFFIEVVAFIFGAIFGSFACCQARRLRLAEKGKKDPGKWSVCLACGKKLTWYENIPIISWLIQGGKCRKCHKKIGATEFLAELCTGLAFAAVAAWYAGLFGSKCGILQIQCSEFNFISGALSVPALIDCALLLVLIAALTSMVILFIYDAKWQVMPTYILILVNILALIITIGKIAATAIFLPNMFNLESTATNLLLAVAILPGLYYLMYVMSKEALVGGGDWILALAIALILGNWWLALLVLFLSNAIASLVMLPFSIAKKQKQICFGPFLIIAFLIVLLAQEILIAFAKGILI